MKFSQKSGTTLAMTAAALLVSGTLATSALADGKGQCVGANACKGQSACKTASSACKGHNACKGKGFTVTTKKACDAAGGTFKS